MTKKWILVTGGAGFIGVNFVRHLLLRGYSVVVLDVLSYAGNMDSLQPLLEEEKCVFRRGDIGDSGFVMSLLGEFQPEYIANLAAESHVDRSIESPEAFVRTNVTGTFRLLEECRAYWSALSPERKNAFRFLHVSTDEVFGSLGKQGFFTEKSPYAPNSPYSASKAASDHFVRAYGRTYGLPVLITNCTNNYGPYQFPEKLIPHMILRALSGEFLPVYGDGSNIRDWIFVEDHCCALLKVLEHGSPGESYVVGGDNERTNLEVVEKICALLDRLCPLSSGGFYRDRIRMVSDRPGHDSRYAVCPAKVKKITGWRPRVSFDEGLEKTVEWYLNNHSWVDRILSGEYRLERLGTIGGRGKEND